MCARLRPTGEGRHPDELDPSKLSGLQGRLIDANLQEHRGFYLHRDARAIKEWRRGSFQWLELPRPPMIFLQKMRNLTIHGTLRALWITRQLRIERLPCWCQLLRGFPSINSRRTSEIRA